MELSDEKVLELLLRGWEQQTSRKRPARVRMPAAPRATVYQAPERKSSARHCRCGVCVKCQENARWDRIFQAKFADPDYYKQRSITHISSLADD